MNNDTCPFPHASVTLDLSNLPPRIAKLPVHRGFPVPWFVGQVNGEYDFRVVGPGKIREAVLQKKCWICGDKLGQWISFTVGPMSCVTRTSAEPPSHRLCARFAAITCPFLTRPNMRRRENGMPEDAEKLPGVALDRNPGVCAVWTVRDYATFHAAGGGVLIDIGQAFEVEWYASGRPATRAEVLHSIDTGMPYLRELCDTEDTPDKVMEAHKALDQRLEALMVLLPAAPVEVDWCNACGSQLYADGSCGTCTDINGEVAP